ncbi:MAG: adenosine kinase [Bacteroidales bacterium]|nr:adenosine kinase [Bacteroidales bacterium]MDD2322660.1 adenosine kinase [Bacteroidales bacterium]MDD3010743.1 adenosine kinase [Bacteroidales bacterium]MDD3961805.1 adenosine kinase [Bacteroidales bacterium]MDY0286653.1 adenosine kinase [Bacteroidales bacterium]
MKIIGMGNALVDIMTLLPDHELLHTFNLPAGSMTLVDEELSLLVQQTTQHLPTELTAGGSACNTIDGLAHLGIETAFIGAVADDHYGRQYKDVLQINGIRPLLFQSTKPTGRAVALVTPDSERTFATFLGAAVDIPLEKITSDLFEGYDLFHVEGYLVYNHTLILAALQAAKKAGLLISLDLASFNVVDENLEFLRYIVKEYIDICFANEEEALSFTGKPPHEALSLLGEMCTWSVVKMGKNGSLILHNQQITVVDSIQCDLKDTTGAGDLYAAGFLFGLTKKWDMKDCGIAGAVLSGKVIEILGARMPDATWNEIKTSLR